MSSIDPFTHTYANCYLEICSRYISIIQTFYLKLRQICSSCKIHSNIWQASLSPFSFRFPDHMYFSPKRCHCKMHTSPVDAEGMLLLYPWVDNFNSSSLSLEKEIRHQSRIFCCVLRYIKDQQRDKSQSDGGGGSKYFVSFLLGSICKENAKSLHFLIQYVLRSPHLHLPREPMNSAIQKVNMP